MLRRYVTAAAAAVLLLSCGKLCFSEENHPAEQEEWNPPSLGPISTWTAPLCERGKVVLQPFFFYNRTRGSFDADGNSNSLPKGDNKGQCQEQLFVQYGLTDRVEVDAQAVYQQNYAKVDGEKASESGFGDSYLFLRGCVLEEKDWMPCVTGLFQLKMPTGKFEHADPNKLGTDMMGAGSWDEGAGVIMTKRIKPFILHADVIYSIPNEMGIDGVKTRYANYLNYDFGAEYFLPKGFNLMIEMNGFAQGDIREDGGRTPGSDVSYLNICPGIGWSCDKLQTLVAYQRTLAGTNTDANDSIVVSCVYTF
jgi:hypothetical protein